MVSDNYSDNVLSLLKRARNHVFHTFEEFNELQLLTKIAAGPGTDTTVIVFSIHGNHRHILHKNYRRFVNC